MTSQTELANMFAKSTSCSTLCHLIDVGYKSKLQRVISATWLFTPSPSGRLYQGGVFLFVYSLQTVQTTLWSSLSAEVNDVHNFHQIQRFCVLANRVDLKIGCSCQGERVTPALMRDPVCFQTPVLIFIPC